MADKTVKGNIKDILNEYGARFSASSEAKKIMNHVSTGSKIKDIASGKRVSALNKYIGALKDNSDGQLSKFIADTRKTRNNELAKTIAMYAAPAAAVTAGTAVLANKIHKKRKDDSNMDKMSAEQYEGFIDKLAEEILEEEYTSEKTASEQEYEDIIAERAYKAYEAAQMQKEAAAADYTEACAYEDAALAILSDYEEE